ncbi:MAG: tape measure protein [Paludibacter sp.]|nr:tape measure protein [Paludibacter sp.]
MKDQQLLFESLSRASTGFGLSADETNGVFLAITQMMGKGKIQAEELRGQLGERMPIAMQAMARAAGTTVAGLDKIMKAGKLMSADVLPKFAKALNEMMPNVNTDNIETSFNRLKNSFKELTDKLNVGGIYKNLLDQTGQGFQWLMNNFKTAGNAIVNIVASLIIGKAINAIIASYRTLEVTALRFYKKQALMSGVAFDEMAYNANKFKNISTVAFAKVGVALKAAFATFAPMLIISGLIAIYQHFSDIAAKTKELKAI